MKTNETPPELLSIPAPCELVNAVCQGILHRQGHHQDLRFGVVHNMKPVPRSDPGCQQTTIFVAQELTTSHFDTDQRTTQIATVEVENKAVLHHVSFQLSGCVTSNGRTGANLCTAVMSYQYNTNHWKGRAKFLTGLNVCRAHLYLDR